MKCNGCGAEINENSKFCEFCGTQITVEMKKEQEVLNKKGCPSCGSSNISFSREKQGEIKGKRGTAVVRATVGVCKDCGHTWNVPDATTKPKNNNMIWWILGWIFFFPIPVMILVWRKKNTWSTKTKIIFTVVFWIFIFALGGKNDEGSLATDNDTDTAAEVIEDSISKEQTKEESTKEEQESKGINHIYDNAEVVDLINGAGTGKIGTFTVVKANQSDCTDEALMDWYLNYVKNNDDSNYHVIVYNDVDNKGVFSTGKGFIQKDIEITLEKNGNYMSGDDAGSTMYTVDEDAKELIVQITMADAAIVNEIKNKVEAVIPNEYKNSDIYSVDVAGEEGSLDCNLTIVNEKFANDDFQSIAVDLATKIKELDLGIGYFCIAFQSDDYTITAISSIDDLTNQETSEISTKEF